jgi:hypothetical protein
MVYFRSAPLPSPGLVLNLITSSVSQIRKVINLDATSTHPLKGEHHKAVWSQCLNILTDSPTQGLMSCLCLVRPPASRLARCPLTMTDHLDYHHVYSYVTTSKNIFVPCSNTGHTTHHNTDNKVHKLPAARDRLSRFLQIISGTFTGIWFSCKPTAPVLLIR